MMRPTAALSADRNERPAMEIAPEYSSFAKIYGEGRPQVVFARLIADLETPVSAFLKLGHARANAFLLESVQGGETRGRYSIIGLRPDLIWRCRDGAAEINRDALDNPDAFQPDKSAAKPLDALKQHIRSARIELPEGLPPMAVGLFGYLGYDMVRLMERLPAAPPDVFGLPDTVLLRPTITAIFDNVRDQIILVTPVWPDTAHDARGAYESAQRRLQDTIADLSRPQSREPTLAQVPLGPVGVEHHPCRLSRDCFQGKGIHPRGRRVPGGAEPALPPRVSASPLRALSRAAPPQPVTLSLFPELPRFLHRGVKSRRSWYVCAMAWSLSAPSPARARAENTEAEDKKLAEQLLADPKERAEHLMLLDLGRNDVGRVAETGSVNVTAQFFIERYSHVMHLVSNVEGRIRKGLDAVDALMAGFPAGTLSGAPKVRAMEIIDELEKEKRGVYAGAVGYFAADGSMDTCIVLRTAVVKDGMMYVQAGGGVVADSDPETEYQETVNKAKALMAAADEAMRNVE